MYIIIVIMAIPTPFPSIGMDAWQFTEMVNKFEGIDAVYVQ